MPYTGDWFEDLIDTEPQGSETKSLGDDAIRQIKRSIHSAFPNTPENDAYTGLLADLNKAVEAMTPRNCIMAWYGFQNLEPDGPAGWTICDGRERKDGSGQFAPDLRGRSIMGAAPDTQIPNIYPAPADTYGGNTDTDIRDLNGIAKQFSTSTVALSTAQVPITPHRHVTLADVVNDTPTTPTAFTAVVRESDDGGSGSNWAYKMSGTGDATEPTVGMTSEAPLGQVADGHSHTFTIEDDPQNPTGSNLSPYWAVLYIIKD